MTEPLKPMVGAEYEPNPQDEAIAEFIASGAALIPSFTTTTEPIDIEKVVSRRRRKAQLISRLKRRRRYPSPVRGGTGKQARTRRKKFG